MAFKGTPRWTVSNVLPVAFVLAVIGAIWSSYVGFHLLRLLQVEEDEDLRLIGIVQTVISQTMVVLMLICFFRAVFTDPGSVPDTPDWLPQSSRTSLGDGEAQQAQPLCHEVKQKGGQRRFCQKCLKYKPDRCHHCRVCNSCILRMDHHCPWIANCVGFRNHKYFFLLVFYAALSCWFIVATMISSVIRAAVDEMDPAARFGLVFGTTLAVIMGTLLGGFFLFHTWLTTLALSTIEFCEKTGQRSSRGVSYNHGLYENMRSVFGPYVLLWLLPLSPPDGDGLVFFVSKGDQKDGLDEVETSPLLQGPASGDKEAEDGSEVKEARIDPGAVQSQLSLAS
mmetsp:Transcript_47122/g.88119  ORF Transcript_47122/g.88119 Transcript_47122/m.88119 type:complete len:338 (-) Transcript_47122:114-1127(-)